MSDDELKAELARREEARKDAEFQEYQRRLVLQRAIVDKVGLQAFFDAFLPEHTRTSCSDDDMQNRYPHYESGQPRCVRCGLRSVFMEEWNNDFMVADLQLTVNPSWQPPRQDR